MIAAFTAVMEMFLVLLFNKWKIAVAKPIAEYASEN